MVIHSFQAVDLQRKPYPMKTPRALLLYEEPQDATVIRAILTGEGCHLDEAPLNGESPVTPEGYCIVVFDIQRLSARLLEVIRGWRDRVPDTMVLVAGARTANANRIAVLETGVEAYLTKPVAVAELRARARAALRRFRSLDSRSRQFPLGSWIVDLEARMIRANDRDTRLTRTECGILEHLASHMNQTVPSTDLVKTLWGADPQKGVHSLRLFIRKLRNKLEPDPAHPRYLVTEPTIGYRLQAAPKAASKLLDS
jgi:two-component system, OmpR family, KDP operon response regulator KdpE